MKIGEIFHKAQLVESLLGQVCDSPAVRLIKNRDEHVFAMQILILAAGLLHMHQRPLDHTLEPDRRLRVLFQRRELRHLRINEFLEIPLQLRLGAAKVGKYAADTVIREQLEQQRLDRNQLTADRCRRDEGVLKILFQLSVDHSYSCRSTKHRKGKPLSFARCIALAARLSATSFT
ncbi:200 kDa antigen p200 putative [Sutterella sp. CAG:351]|nr:200 kDa antigen p200 putative [Sutterella sp. CAG:351]